MVVKKHDTAVVSLWGQTVGAVAWLQDRNYGVFEYEPEFLQSGLNISPLHMDLDQARHGSRLFSFPALNKDTFLGLPGLLADALPDKFGNHIIDAWLACNGRAAISFSSVERLCYSGKRAMGALEFSPAIMDKYDTSVAVEVSELVLLAQAIMQQRNALDVQLDTQREQSSQSNADAVLDILRVGTSAGGARPKAVIAMDKHGNVMSGQAEVPAEFDYWMIKFDGVADMELGEPKGYGRIEYAYYLMAQAAGINMTECCLLEENGRAHFITKRFDRVAGNKLHMQSLCGVAHYDFNQAGAYSYEQAFMVMRQLRLSQAEASEQFRRMLFNIMARNLDDHTKNIAYIMDTEGRWQLSPAYDVIYAHNPAGKWTSQHQMSINGKRDNFTREDILKIAESISLKKVDDMIGEVVTAIERWPEFAKQAGVSDELADEIGRQHRLNFC